MQRILSTGCVVLTFACLSVSTRPVSAASGAALPVVAAPGAGAGMIPEANAGQQNKDPLSQAESDQIAELRDQPVPRIKLYQKFIEQRISAIKDLGTNPK